MHVHCLHWLMSTGLFFQSTFCWPCKSTTGEMAPKERLQFSCEDLVWLPLSVHICLGPVVEYWPFVGACTHHSYSKLCYLYHLSSLLKILPLPTPPPCPSHPPPYIHWPSVNEFQEKIVKNWWKTSHYLLARLVLQNLIDNLSSLNESNTKARLVFSWIFKMAFLKILASVN